MARNLLIAFLLLAGAAIVGVQIEPPKGFTKMLWHRPKELVKAKNLDFAYVKIKPPGLDREVWLTIGSVPRNAARWTVTLDTTFNDNMDDDASVETGEPESNGFRSVRRFAKGEWTVGDKKFKWKFEFRDDFLGPAARIDDSRMISVKISKD
ncbi:MAG: hypothetical protein AKCLJLPJ_00568 [Fimbriimonadales bacterium]|nr:MAG: hypothetical protein EDM73_03055 [Armatimonadota bacterium]MBV6502521.1 hypothetical protein [Fimbriimonadales bacterium]MCE7898636.1 hypothetical protein [Armatimonadetes bacterium ATM1]MDL1928071.1 hypothetical protein [Fimbriimonadia bacterium ATM]MBC6968525.1 hypothetical protein [Armatimonadota bacterium]